MPIHDWTRVDAAIFHHFHHGWIEDLSRALNHGLLPPDFGGYTTESSFRLRAEPDLYAAKANAIVVRHISHHEIIAIVEIVSPGNKSSRHGLRSFVEKAISLANGCSFGDSRFIPSWSSRPRRHS